jgi:hypothetical protein
LGRGVNAAEPGAQSVYRIDLRDVRLGKDDHVSRRDLSGRLGVAISVEFPVYGVDRRYHAVHDVVMLEEAVREDGEEDGSWVC